MAYVLIIASFADCFSSTIYLSLTMSHVLPPFSTLEQTKKRQSPKTSETLHSVRMSDFAPESRVTQLGPSRVTEESAHSAKPSAH